VQVPVHHADGELPHPDITEWSQDVPVQLMPVGRHRGRAQSAVLGLGIPGFGQRGHPGVGAQLSAAAAVRAVAHGGGQQAFGGRLGPAVLLDLAGHPVVVPVARTGPPAGRGAIGSNAAGRTDRKGRADHDHFLPFNSRKMVQNADKQRRELISSSLLG
jgi:hypothetical protein